MKRRGRLKHVGLLEAEMLLMMLLVKKHCATGCSGMQDDLSGRMQDLSLERARFCRQRAEAYR